MNGEESRSLMMKKEWRQPVPSAVSNTNEQNCQRHEGKDDKIPDTVVD